MSLRNIVAIDLGASSGRVMLASWQADRQQLSLREVRRFANPRVQRGDYDCWDLDRRQSRNPAPQTPSRECQRVITAGRFAKVFVSELTEPHNGRVVSLAAIPSIT